MTLGRGRATLMAAVAAVLIGGASTSALALNPARVRGTVQGPDGEPAGGVTVVLEPRQGGRPPRTVKTKDDGSFTVPFIEFGTYRMRVDAAGMSIGSFKVTEKGPRPKMNEPLEGMLGPDQEFPEIELQPSHEYTVELVLRTADETESLRAEEGLAESAGEVREAQSLFQSGDLDGALAALDAVLASDGENGLAHYLRGMVLLKQADPEEALEALRRAAELVPRQAGVHFGLGTALLELADAREDLGKVDAAAAMRAEAADELERERALSPDSAEVLTNLALARQKAGQKEKAAESFEALIELRPDDLNAYFALADCYNDLGRTDDAMATLDRIPLGGADVAVAFYNVAVTLFNERKADLAAVALERGLQQDAEHAKSWRLLGMARLQTGDTEGALTALRRFLELAPDDPEAPQVQGLVDYLESQKG